jgi:hypothetical protein
MNFNGTDNFSNLQNGGNIEGDLDIIGDLNVANFTANNGVIINNLEVGTLVSDIQVEDPIILLGKDNPSNNLNLGIVEEFNNGGIKYSGILRSKDDNEHYILENLTTLPNGSTNITALSKGNLNCSKLSSSELSVISTNGSLNINPNNATQSILTTSDNNASVGTVSQIIKTRGTPSTPLAILENDVISRQVSSGYNGSSLSSAGQIVFEATEDHTLSGSGSIFKLQTTNDGDVAPTDKLTVGTNGTTLTSKNFKYNSETGVESVVFASGFNFWSRADDNGGGFGIVISKARGSLDTPTAILNTNAMFENYFRGYDGTSYKLSSRVDVKATENFSTSGIGSSYKISTTDNGQTAPIQKLLIDTSGITINDSTNSITFPNNRGTSGQVMTTDGVGSSSWVGSSYGFQYFNDNTTFTSIASVNTFASIDGTRVAGLLQNFTSDASGLKYTGVNTKIFKTDFCCTWALDGGSADACEVAIFKNGVIIPGSKQLGSLDDSNDFPRNCSTNAIISLDTNDIIDIRVANTQDTTNILVRNYSLTISGV